MAVVPLSEVSSKGETDNSKPANLIQEVDVESKQTGPSSNEQGSNAEGLLKPCTVQFWDALSIDPNLFKSLGSDKRLSIIRSVQTLETSCLQSAGYYAQLGQLQLLAGFSKDAIESLERSLLLNSDQPEVQLDFALSLAESGDPVSAKALVEQILIRPDLPAPLRENLLALKARSRSESLGDSWEPGREPARSSASLSATQEQAVKQYPFLPTNSLWQAQGNAQILLGHDSNLNSASFVNVINLTLPNGVVPLSLDSSSLPQSGSTSIAAIQLQAQKPIDSKVLMVSGSWMGRSTPENPRLGFNNLEIIAHVKPENDWGLHHQVSVNRFDLGATPVFNGFSYSAWLENSIPRSIRLPLMPEMRCRSRVGGDVERRMYPQDPSQNGLFGAVLLGGECADGVNLLTMRWTGGVDWASDDLRAGGNQRRQEIKGSWVHSYENSKLSLEWSEQWLSDDAIYSALLGGINRNTIRKSMRLSFQYKLNDKLGMMLKSPIWVSYWESLRYSSSIDLFNLRGESIQTGLKWGF